MTWSAAGLAQFRSESARLLFERAQSSQVVELVTLSALDACVLGGPKQALFDEAVTHAWLQLGDRARAKAVEAVTESLIRRGLLAERQLADGRNSDADNYDMQPELGVVLAARSRPAFVVVCEIDRTEARAPRMFALGDQVEPVRGIVVELPTAPPVEDFPHLRKLGVLGWFYRYVLVSQPKAAQLLAEWAIQPIPQQLQAQSVPARVVSVYRHDEGQDFLGLNLTVHGDGRIASLVRSDAEEDGGEPLEYDETELSGIMADLMDLRQR